MRDRARFDEESTECDAGQSRNMRKSEAKKTLTEGFSMNCSSHFIGNGKDMWFISRLDVHVVGNAR